MRQIKQLLAMRFGAGASTPEVARGSSVQHVREYLSGAAAAWIGCRCGGRHRREPDARLFGNAGARRGAGLRRA
jgi:hypothetical protein